jgi:lysine 2,3-aminomutase
MSLTDALAQRKEASMKHQQRPVSRLVISARAHAFRKRFFPTVQAHDWNDWRWQLRHRIKDLGTLARILRLSDDERTAIARHQGPYP